LHFFNIDKITPFTVGDICGVGRQSQEIVSGLRVALSSRALAERMKAISGIWRNDSGLAGFRLGWDCLKIAWSSLSLAWRKGLVVGSANRLRRSAGVIW